MAKGRKVKVSSRGMRTRGKTRPTVRLADQLMNTTIEEAAERELCVNISPVMSQGMDPFPRAKNTTKISVVAMRKAPMSSF